MKRVELAPSVYSLSKRAAVACLAALGVKLRVRGLEHIPTDSPAILVANHPSMLDGWLLVATIPRRLHFFYRPEYFANPALAWYGRAMGAVPAHRGAASAGALDEAADVLRKRGLFLSFPEGTVNAGPRLRPFSRGFVRLATTFDVPVVPIAIHGSDAIVRRFPRRGRLAPEVTVLEPLRLGPPPTDRAAFDQQGERVRALIAQCLGQSTSESIEVRGIRRSFRVGAAPPQERCRQLRKND